MSIQPNNQEIQINNYLQSNNSQPIHQLQVQTHRSGMTLSKTNQKQQPTRLANSKSVKSKFNEQNTKLRINVDNLSKLTLAHEEHEGKYQREIDRYKQKLTKYKGKLKQKDNIIVRLLDKLEKNSVTVNGNWGTMLKQHEEYVREIKEKIGKGQDVDGKTILERYEELVKGLGKEEKWRVNMEKEKQMLEKTVVELKAMIQNGEIRQINVLKQNQETDNLKSKLIDPNHLLQKLKLTQQNLFKQRQTLKHQQQTQQNLYREFSALVHSFGKSNTQLSNLQQTLLQLENKYIGEIKQLEGQLDAKIEEEKQLEKYRNQVEQIAELINRYIQNAQNSQNWNTLQEKYKAKLKQYQQRDLILHDQYDTMQQRRKIFELKLINNDQQPIISNMDLEQGEDRWQYLLGKLDRIIGQSRKNKQENRALMEDMENGRQNYQIISNQLKIAESRVLKMEALLKKSGNDDIEHDDEYQKFLMLKQESGQPISNENIRKTVLKETEGMTTTQLKSKLLDIHLQNNTLQTRLTELQLENNILKKQNDQIRKQSQGVRDVDDPLIRSTTSSKIKTLSRSGRILKKGESYLESSNIEGGYEVNIINVNEIPVQIQEMSFQELASKYETAREQLEDIRQKTKYMENSKKSQQQQKLNQVNIDSQQKQMSASKRDMVGDDEQNYEELGNSEEIEEDVYKNINEELDRLTIKNRQLEREIEELKKEQNVKRTSYENLAKQYNNKLKSYHQTNENLSNLVIHLEEELSRYQNNLDISEISQRGSEITEGSAKKIKDEQQNNEQKSVMKRKDYEKMKKNTEGAASSKKYLQNEELLLSMDEGEKSLTQKQENQRRQKYQLPVNYPYGSEYECPNCQSLTKVNADLAKKVNKFQQQKIQKEASLQKQLEILQKQINIGLEATPQNMSQIFRINRKLIQALNTMKIQITAQRMNEKQLTEIKEMNEQLRESLHEKQKMLLKLKTSHQRQSVQQREDKEKNNSDRIIESYQKKIEEMEIMLEKQDKNERNTADLYDTIKYLNNECENLKKKLNKQSVGYQSSKIGQQLSEKQRDALGQLQKLQKIAEQNGYKDIEEMLVKCGGLVEKNENLMKQNGRLKNKVDELNGEIQGHLKNNDEGKNYEMIQKVEQQKEMGEMGEEGEQIGKEITNIEVNAQKLDKPTDPYSQQSQKNTQAKPQQRTSLADLFSKRVQIPQKSAQNYPPQNNLLQNLSIKLQKLKNDLESTSLKTRPNFEIPSYRQLPILEDILKILLNRLKLVCIVFEQRTNQYNQLREQMNIISQECMKSAQLSVDVEKQEQNQKDRIEQICQNRYEQVVLQLIEYENQNKRLEKQVNRLKQQISSYKKQVQEVQNRYMTELKTQSNQQLPFNQNLLHRLLESGTSLDERDSVSERRPEKKEVPEIIKIFLERIGDLEKNLQQIEIEFNQKNQRLEELVEKEKSFIVKNGLDQSVSSKNQRQLFENKQNNDGNKIGGNYMVSSSFVSPVGMISEKSYSVNSVRLFKEIEELTKINEELRDRKHKYRNLLEGFSKSAQVGLKNPLNAIEQQWRRCLQNYVSTIAKQLQEDSKKDNSVFDFDGDMILSSSFAQKPRNNMKLHSEGEALEEINHTFDAEKLLEINEKIKKRQEDKIRRNAKKNELLHENQTILQEVLKTINEEGKVEYNLQTLKKKILQKLSLQEIQQIFNPNNINNAIGKIIGLMTEPEKKVAFEVCQKELLKIKTEESHQFQEQQAQGQGEYVEAQQIQAIINRIYPKKTELCIIAANSVNMFMAGETEKQILKGIEYLFSNLKRKQNEFKDEIRKRDETVAIYGQKLQNLLNKKYSQQQSYEKSELLNENQFKKTQGFKSEYQLKKELQNDSMNKSNSQSYSGILEKSLK